MALSIQTDDRTFSRTTSDSEVSFRLTGRNGEAQVPPESWTELGTDGERIVIRTCKPVELLGALCASGAELPEIEVRRRPPAHG